MANTTELQKQLKEWFNEGSNPESVAVTLLWASKGDARKLLSSHENPDGVYGVASEKLFKGENTEIHRFLLRNAWITNKKGVRETFVAHSKLQGKRKNLKTVNADENHDAFCWCKSTLNPQDPTSIKCRQCKKYYHCLCVALTGEQAVGLKDFICPKCEGTLTVPPLFRTPKGLKGDSDDVAKADGNSQRRGAASSMLSKLKPSGARNNLSKLPGFSSIRRKLLPSQTENLNTHDNATASLNTNELGNIPLQSPIGLEKLSPATENTGTPEEKDFGLEILPVSDEEDRSVEEPDNDSNYDVESREDSEDDDDEHYDEEGDLEKFDSQLGDVSEQDENESTSSDGSVQFLTEVQSTRNLSVKVEEEVEAEEDALLSQALDDVEGKLREEEQSKPSQHDTSYMPTSFQAILTSDQWKRVIRRVTIDVDDDSFQWYQGQPGYSTTLQKVFSTKNKCCVLYFNKITIREPHQQGQAFLRCYGICKGVECKARYAFTVREVTPVESNNVLMNVRKTNPEDIKHLSTERLQRPLKGEERKEMKKKLISQKPFRVLTDEYANGDKEQLKFGNVNVVKTLKVLQQARVEARKEGDYHPDVVVDLALTHIKQKEEWKGTKMSGFLQNISLFPFWMTFLCEGQLRLLRKMTRSDKVTMYFDSTGMICEPLPPPLDQTKIQYYGLVVKDPKKNDAPIPLLEFYSSRHDLSAISFQLTFFLERYKDLYETVKGREYGIRRVETDFAKAMIAACCKCFQNGFLEEYLITLNTSLSEKKSVDEDLVAIHVCSFHVDKFLNEKLDAIFKAETAKIAAKSKNKGKKKMEMPDALKEKERLLRLWGRLFVTASSYAELVHRMTEIITLTGSLYYTNEVRNLVKTFGRQPEENEDYRRFAYKRMRGVQFYLRSPFGQIAQQISKQVEEKNNRLRQQEIDGIITLAPNEYADSGFLSYLLTHVLPYAPILTHCVFTAHNIAIDGDTNNNVELWMKILKRNYFQELDWSNNGIRAPRLARSHATMIKGLLAKATTGDGVSLSQSEDEDPNQEEEGSPEKQVSVWEPKRQSQPVKQNMKTNLQGMPLMPLGGNFSYDKHQFHFRNTCNIDCTLQIMFYLFRHTDKGRQFFNAKQDELGKIVKRMFTLMEERKMQLARLTWVRSVLGIKDFDVNFNGAEREQGVGGVKMWFEYISKTVTCSRSGCPRNEMEAKVTSSIDEHPSSPEQFISWFQQEKNSVCNICHSMATEFFRLNGDPPALIAYTCDSRWVTKSGVDIYAPEDRLDKVQTIGGTPYSVAAYTIYTGDHFYVVFWDKNCRYIYNGSEIPLRVKLQTEISTLPVHTVWLLRD